MINAGVNTKNVLVEECTEAVEEVKPAKITLAEKFGTRTQTTI